MERVVVIGAGVGGLSAAMRLSNAGAQVTVLDRHSAPGGKMRVVETDAGPVDAGPTVLTLKPFFERIFDEAGVSLADYVTLQPLEMQARHHWQNGSTLDLFVDHERTLDAIGVFAGPTAVKQFARFHAKARALFEAFEKPMMLAPEPTLGAMAGIVARAPQLIPAMTPGRSLAGALRGAFDDPRLRQLFGRYATYVGGYPAASPALLSLIWYAESQGVWAVEGGMHTLARAMQQVAESNGAIFRLGEEAGEILVVGDRVRGVQIADEVIPADNVVFGGDPRALHLGLLGDSAQSTVPAKAVSHRSLSAFVWSFAAKTNKTMAHHNVYFGADPASEFKDIAQGKMPSDPTLYVCAQDAAKTRDQGRFEIIMNGPPRAATIRDEQEAETCRTTTFDTLETMGLTFSPKPSTNALTTPEEFNAMFPGTDGSIYGLSPHGMLAAFQRPTARTKVQGLYLAGGGAHPGAGIPMAAISGLHAAEAMLTDRALRSPSRQTATRGGTSTASPTMANAPSRSSPS